MQPSESPTRQISDISLVRGEDDSMNCGPNNQLVSMVVLANPGSVMEFYWGDPSEENWPHNTGPLMTYMGACDTSSPRPATSLMAQPHSGSESTRSAGSRTGPLGISRTSVAVHIVLLSSSGRTTYLVNSTHSEQKTHLFDAPDAGKLAPGDYLVRKEIIALHRTQTLGGAEFYPSWTQIRVWWLANGHAQPNRLLRRRIQQPRHRRSKHLYKGSALRPSLSRSARVEPRFARGHDWPAVDEQ
ncbi:hypothetical protein DFH94DRAFT_191296 [Russula ochroleuca]|uniref:lytic cellulose monooxygenase (C4-dehydrogenating) n=1 Tax=Russula ochroleuca TaxID=152965 RepID=A0A9P5K071_9AGAM|nr:hypothetical protein DFH94DRAFT_191296 [Russula ochroleuca]